MQQSKLPHSKSIQKHDRIVRRSIPGYSMRSTSITCLKSSSVLILPISAYSHTFLIRRAVVPYYFLFPYVNSAFVMVHCRVNCNVEFINHILHFCGNFCFYLASKRLYFVHISSLKWPIYDLFALEALASLIITLLATITLLPTGLFGLISCWMMY